MRRGAPPLQFKSIIHQTSKKVKCFTRTTMNKTKKTLPIISEEEEKEIRLFSRFRNERPYIHKNADEKDTNAQIRLMYEDDVANLIKNINDNDSIFPRIDESNTKITEIKHALCHSFV